MGWDRIEYLCFCRCVYSFDLLVNSGVLGYYWGIDYICTLSIIPQAVGWKLIF